jgi:hypothetical protein
MKKRLSDAGIKSAADIINIHIAQSGWGRYSHEVAYIEISGQRRIHVEGIGPTKAQALLSWKRDIESRFRGHMPQSLPTAQETVIRSKYQAQRQSIDRQEIDANYNARQRKEEVLGKYRQEQDALTNQSHDFRDQFAKQRRDHDQKIRQQEKHLSEKHWTLAKVQREFDAYRQVNFAVYLKRVLFL